MGGQGLECRWLAQHLQSPVVHYVSVSSDLLCSLQPMVSTEPCTRHAPTWTYRTARGAAGRVRGSGAAHAQEPGTRDVRRCRAPAARLSWPRLLLRQWGTGQACDWPAGMQGGTSSDKGSLERLQDEQACCPLKHIQERIIRVFMPILDGLWTYYSYFVLLFVCDSYRYERCSGGVCTGMIEA